jgi:uncharacterized membrane protein
MGKINWGRVFVGGLVAGLIINLFEYVTNGVVLAANWDAAMKALGRHFPASAIPVFIVGDFITGVAAIWLYAAARPRFGVGPKTAALTGFAYWIMGYALPTLGQIPLGLFPKRLLVFGCIVGLVEIVVASVVGAWLYRE